MGGPPARQELVALAADRIRSGRLPAANIGRLVAGHGQNHHCSLCDTPIAPAEIEYEVPVQAVGAPRPLYLHIECYHAWVSACGTHAAHTQPG